MTTEVTEEKRRTRRKKDTSAAPVSMPKVTVAKVARQRQTLPTNANILGSFPYAFLPRRQYQSVDLSSINVSVLSPQQVIDLLSDADPDVSLAWWNFLLLTVGAWTTDARTPDDEEDTVAKDALNALLARVNAEWGGFRNLLYMWVMSVLLEGACAGETIPTDDLKDVIDITAVTPWTIFFQRNAMQQLLVFQWQPMVANGMVDLGQAMNIPNLYNASMGVAGFRELNTTTFGYVPFMPMVDDPYGRMPFASIFQVIVFDNQLLQDLRRWAHINAWGRMDVSIMQEMVQNLMPPAVKNNKAELISFIQNYIADVVASYNDVGPDDTFVHLDSVKVSSVNAAGTTMQIDNLIRAVERKKFRALKMLPIFMGSNEGTTESHGSIQLELFARGVEAIQESVASLANALLTAALRLQGFTAHAVLTFDRIRANDRLADANAESIEIKNAAAKRDQGWITQDEAAIAITGSPAVTVAPNPDPEVAPNQPDSGTENTDKDVDKNVSQEVPAVKAQRHVVRDKTSDKKRDKTPTKPHLSKTERAALQEEMARLLPDALRAEKQDDAPKWSASAAHKRARKSLAISVAAHFDGITVKAQTVTSIRELFNGRAYSKRLKTRDAQRTANRATIAQMLHEDIPDHSEPLETTLSTGRLAAYNLGGQEGLKRVGIDGAGFTLTNAVLLGKIAKHAQESAVSIQQTTRNQLATVILDAIDAGGDEAAVSDAIDTSLEDMTGARSDSIAQYEVDDSYWDGSLDGWSQNGVGFKVWGTSADPDPGAGKSGATPCRDNSYAGAIPVTDTFPSGDDAPPAHNECACFLEPSGDPSEAAQSDPWLGD